MSPRTRRRSESPTIVDVAREARVSVSTVSRVVRNHADVNEETRDRVMEVIRTLGYRPSPIARALVSGRSQTIGLLVSDIVNPFYPQLAKSIEQEAHQHGYAVVICNTEDSEEKTQQYVERLLDQGTEGIIHASVGPDEERTLKQVADLSRIVFTNRRPRSTRCNYVVVDNYAGAVDLTRHLLELGHRRIGFITGPGFATNATDRLQGFLDTMRDAGADYLVAEGDFRLESGTTAVRRWLMARRRPTAIIGVNDLVALGAFDALLEAGVRVPDDIAVAGFDDTQLSGSRLVGLTSVAQHIDDIGRRAVKILMEVAGKRGVEGLYQEVVKPELVVRRSTVGEA